MIISIGDGISDLPSSFDADVLFARSGLNFEQYCIENRIVSAPFDVYAKIQRDVVKVAKIGNEKKGRKGMPANLSPRVNLER